MLKILTIQLCLNIEHNIILVSAIYFPPLAKKELYNWYTKQIQVSTNNNIEYKLIIVGGYNSPEYIWNYENDMLSNVGDSAQKSIQEAPKILYIELNKYEGKQYNSIKNPCNVI